MKKIKKKVPAYGVGSILASTGSMAAVGAPIAPPWGAIAGAAVGLTMGIVDEVQGSKKAKQEAELRKFNQEQANNRAALQKANDEWNMNNKAPKLAVPAAATGVLATNVDTSKMAVSPNEYLDNGIDLVEVSGSKKHKFADNKLIQKRDIKYVYSNMKMPGSNYTFSDAAGGIKQMFKPNLDSNDELSMRTAERKRSIQDIYLQNLRQLQDYKNKVEGNSPKLKTVNANAKVEAYQPGGKTNEKLPYIYQVSDVDIARNQWIPTYATALPQPMTYPAYKPKNSQVAVTTTSATASPEIKKLPPYIAPLPNIFTDPSTVKSNISKAQIANAQQRAGMTVDTSKAGVDTAIQSAGGLPHLRGDAQKPEDKAAKSAKLGATIGAIGGAAAQIGNFIAKYEDKPEIEKPVENPYAAYLNRQRGVDLSSVYDKIKQNYKTTMYNAGVMPSSHKTLYRMAAANTANNAYRDAAMQGRQMENNIITAQDQIRYQLGEQDRANMMQTNLANAQNRAASDMARNQAFQDLQRYAAQMQQNNYQRANNDLLMPAVKSNLEQGVGRNASNEAIDAYMRKMYPDLFI